MKKNRILDLLIVILVGVVLFSGYKLFLISKEAKETRKEFQQLEQLTQTETENNTDPQPITSQQKYQSVYDSNNDFVGWVYVPDTQLNYPVMHTPSAPEYYLRRDFNSKYSVRGVPFIDYRCTVDQSDNTIIYGHNMTNGTMFSIVEDYADKNFWQQHRYIGFDTLNGYGTYEIAVCANVDLMTTDFNYIGTIDFADEAHFNTYIDQVKNYACYETDVQLCYGDKLLLLSTCETNYDNGRYFILAKKISDEDLSSLGK